MAALSAHHQEQIGSFLRFASYQREQHIKELDAVFEEMADSRCGTRGLMRYTFAATCEGRPSMILHCAALHQAAG